jgi:hypothetical protein
MWLKAQNEMVGLGPWALGLGPWALGLGPHAAMVPVERPVRRHIFDPG